MKMSDDERHMRAALKLAQHSRGQTSPNPMVGAIVVDASGAVAGSGSYAKPNPEHAEAIALREAGDRARGATLYVTLEPCSHSGRDRPVPCAELVVRSGLARVVCAMQDPDAREQGAGLAALRARGIDLSVGTSGEEAARLNRAYVHHRMTGRPFVTLKMAQSLDGAIVARVGERRQLTGKPADRYTRTVRYEHDAIMVGVGTVIVDDPLLTIRPYKPRTVPYTRIVVDASGRIPVKAKVTKDQTHSRTIVATTDRMPEPTREALAKRGVSILECARSGEGRVDLGDMLARLGSAGMISIVCEGGPALGASLVADGHVNQVDWLIAPLLLGGPDAVPAIAAVARDVPLRVETLRRLGDDVLIAGEVVR